MTEIASIDLKDGNAWWETRLLVLCAGAMSPSSALRAVVFIGRRHGRDRMFLGWGIPAQLLRALLDANSEYRARLAKARMIVHQLATFGGQQTPLLPLAGAAPVTLHPNVALHQWSYDEDESVMLAKILFQELQTPSQGAADPRSLTNLEERPTRLTTGRLQELFDSCLYTDTVDRGESNDQQLSRFLASTSPYVAVVRQGSYEGILRADLGERAIVRDLLAMSSKESR